MNWKHKYFERRPKTYIKQHIFHQVLETIIITNECLRHTNVSNFYAAQYNRSTYKTEFRFISLNGTFILSLI